MSSKYIALIPAYQPTELLAGLVQQLAPAFSIVLVDDGSGKAYERVFERCKPYAEVLRHSENRGKGRALKTGLSHIREKYSLDHIVVTVDADGQHCVDDAVAVCRAAEQSPSALILGSRSFQEGVPLRSRFGNAVTRLVYRLSTGVAIYDTQTGLRAFSAVLIPTLLSIPGERYEYEMNVLLYCARNKVQMQEQKIETLYFDNNAGSHFSTLRDSARIYREILKFSASSFVGFLVDYGVYTLLLLSGNLALANVGARIVSASVNFTLNYKFVFQNKGGVVKAAVRYFLLAALILFGNTVVLELLVNLCGIHQMLAKVLTEVLFFLFSWFMQKFVVFGKRGAQ